jgi:hypothetical protein
MNALLLPDVKDRDNRPPELIAQDAINKLVETANQWVTAHSVIEDEAIGTQCADFLNQLEAYQKRYDEAWDAEKKPHDEEIAKIRRKWAPLLNKIEACIQVVRPLHTAWLRLKKTRLADEREAKRREAEEAQRRADQLAAQAGAGSSAAATNLILAKEAEQEAQQARKAAAAVPARAQSKGALGGRTRGLTQYWRAQVVDQDAFYQHVRARQETEELFHRMANAEVRAKDGPRPLDGQQEGINPALPGCLIYCEER